MSRPGDWWALDLDRDPVPGSPSAVRAMARSWSGLADDAEYAETRMRQLMGDGAIGAWIGEAGDAFREKTGDLPDQLGKCKDSYRLAADALSWWADRLAAHQADADAALVKGRAAHADLDQATAQASAATAGLHAASGSTVLADAARYAGRPPVDASLVPTAAQVSAARHRLASAQAAATAADAAVAAAQSRLEQARSLALDAAALRDGDARRTASRIHEAADAGIPERSWWDKAKDWAAEAWHVVVSVAKVVVAVLGIVALIIGGPLAWVVFAAALLVLADTIMKWQQGKASLWDVGLATLACIPGTKGLTSLEALSGAFKAGGAIGAVAHIGGAARSAVVGMAGAVRTLGAGARTYLRGLTAELSVTAALRLGPGEGASLLDGLGHDVPVIFKNDPRLYAQELEALGAAELPTSGRLGQLLQGYDRYGTTGDAATFLDTFTDGSGGIRWPDNAGFEGERVVLNHQAGDVLDRFGPPSGRYLSPDGTPFPERAIPPSNLDPMTPDLGYHRYEVLKPFDAPTGYVAPWFGQPGRGLQIFIDRSHFPEAGDAFVNVRWLLDKGYLKEIGLS